MTTQTASKFDVLNTQHSQLFAVYANLKLVFDIQIGNVTVENPIEVCNFSMVTAQAQSPYNSLARQICDLSRRFFHQKIMTQEHFTCAVEIIVCDLEQEIRNLEKVIS